MNDSDNKSDGWRAFLSRPWIVFAGLIGALASTIALPLSVYFFFASREFPELTYLVHPVKAAVVRTGQTSHLSVQFDGEKVDRDVSAAQIAFWNAGRRPIRNDAILTPLVIQTDHKIFEARLLKSSRDVVGLKLDSSRLSLGEVEIRWNILEKNDGGIVQIIYEGDEKTKIVVNALTEGQPKIYSLQYDLLPAYPNISRRNAPCIFILAIATVGVASFIILSYVKRCLKGKMTIWTYIQYSLMTIGGIIILLAFWLLLCLNIPGPPFGF